MSTRDGNFDRIGVHLYICLKQLNFRNDEDVAQILCVSLQVVIRTCAGRDFHSRFERAADEFGDPRIF
jgi:hypothetical protein